MFFDIFLYFYLWSFFDAEMRADLDFFDAEKPNPNIQYSKNKYVCNGANEPDRRE
jgi:hypothetical protein